MESLDYMRIEMVSLFDTYLKCKKDGESAEDDFRVELGRDRIRFGLYAGMTFRNMETIRVDWSTSKDFTAGISADFGVKRFKGVSFIGEVFYTSNTNTATREVVEINFFGRDSLIYQYEFAYNTLKFSGGLKYTLYSKNSLSRYYFLTSLTLATKIGDKVNKIERFERNGDSAGEDFQPIPVPKSGEIGASIWNGLWIWTGFAGRQNRTGNQRFRIHSDQPVGQSILSVMLGYQFNRNK